MLLNRFQICCYGHLWFDSYCFKLQSSDCAVSHCINRRSNQFDNLVQNCYAGDVETDPPSIDNN